MEGEGKREKSDAVRIFKCKDCGKSLTGRQNLRRHRVEAHLHGPFACSVCGGSYSRKSWLKNHKCGQGTMDRPLTCEECGRAFTKPRSLAAHIATHFSSSALLCEVCNKHFTNKYSLKRHLSTHSGVRNFVCVECGREYSQRGSLNKHVRSCHGSLLQGEGEGVKRKGNIEATPELLQAHPTDKRKNYKSRGGIRAHECKECGRRFTCRYILKQHLITHSKKKLYKCEECGKAYMRKDVCTQHTRTHFTTKEMICDHCGKVFWNKGSLRQHILTHLPKQHKCEECGKEFTLERFLLIHAQNVHSSKEEL